MVEQFRNYVGLRRTSPERGALYLTAQTESLQSFTRMDSDLRSPMKFGRGRRRVIMVIEDIEETCHGIERLLTSDGYSVVIAKDESEAILKARLTPPDLILMSLGVETIPLIAVAERIRKSSKLKAEAPIVLFCVSTIDEGAEVEVPNHVYLTRPDNFDQLRRLLSRLLR